MDSLKESYGDEIANEVSNAAVLTAAQAAYETLYAEYTAVVEDFKTKVSAIGEVTKDNYINCLAPITAAEGALDTLLDTYGAAAANGIVEQSEALSAARAEYNRLAELVDYPYGDIDGNGSIDASDALKALQHSVKLITLTGDDFTVADVDGNNTVDASDALYILQHSVKLIAEFPVQKQ